MANNQRSSTQAQQQRGVALITVLMILLIASALAVALMYTVNSEQRLQSNDAQGGIAYYGAEAGMEKMMADLALLYSKTSSPTPAQIEAVACPTGTGACTEQPDPTTLNGTSFSEYLVDVPLAQNGKDPNYQQRTISSGTNAGLIAQILPLTLSVTANQPGGQQVRMTRSVEIALIPIFQFGVFCDGDCDYFAGADFTFGGRVQTNQNLFLASGTNNSLIFTGPVRAYIDVVRDTLENGITVAASGHSGSVYIATIAGGCNGFTPPGAPPATCRALSASGPDEGSVTGGAMFPLTEPSFNAANAPNNGWPALSQNTYGGQIQNGAGNPAEKGTGAGQLTLPFVQPGVGSIEIVRKGQPGDSQSLTDSRLFYKAQVRVLLADTEASLCAGDSFCKAGDGNNIQLVNDKQGDCKNKRSGNPCFAENDPGASGDGDLTGNGAAGTTSSIGGWLRVEYRDSNGNYNPITSEWLGFGVTRGLFQITDSEHGVANPYAGNAGTQPILLLQQPRCQFTGPGGSCPLAPGVPGGTAPLFNNAATTDFMPINIYDTREGNMRDVDDGICRVGGVMNLVDIDVGALSQWLSGGFGTSGNKVESTSLNGYMLYFSDRRGMLPNPVTGTTIGEYGFTDVINEANSQGTPNNAADQGELLDPNGTGVETFGAANLGQGFHIVAPPNQYQLPATALLPTANPTSPTLYAACFSGMKNYVSGARHGVRLINGSLGNLPLRPTAIADPNNTGGFTLASENPAYVIGNYNATDGGFGDPHASSAVIADTVTLLSKAWSDLTSFTNPTNAVADAFGGGRKAASSNYRVAIATGKNQPFALSAVAKLNCTNSVGRGSPPGPCPQDGKAPSTDFGTDGGMHNFLRFLENWTNQTVNYRGSMVSLYFSYYGTGVFKCCISVYKPPTRGYNFDTDFQNLSEEPPGTPRFEDVVNVGFRQDFTNVRH